MPKQPKPRVHDVFDTLWAALPHPVGSVVRLFTRSGDVRDGDFARNAQEIRNFAKANEGKNIYIAPNPTCSTLGSRHSAKDVTHWSFFAIDIDPVCSCNPTQKRSKDVRKKCQTCRGKADPLAALEMALSYLGEWTNFDFMKTRPLIIDSGRGMQAWIRLADIEFPPDPQIEVTTIHSQFGANTSWISIPNRSMARRVNGYWLKRLDERLGIIHGCRIDTSVSDLPRVLRCPGTMNIKTGRMTDFIHVTCQRFEGLAQTLVSGVPEAALTDPVSDEIAAGQTWQHVYSHLTRTAQLYLTTGQEEPGRHRVMWHTARKLREVGVTKNEARKALKWANGLKGKETALPLEQVEHALDTAFQK